MEREEVCRVRKSQIAQAFQVGFTFIGTVVGAGFASGQEILQFFTQYGYFGYIGILISTLLMGWVGMRVLLLGAELRASSYRQLNSYLFGERWSTLIDIFMMAMLFGVTVAMLAGVGALFQENLNIPFQIGVVATMLLTYITLIYGMKGIMYANSVIVPTMISIFMFILLASVMSASPSTSTWNLEPPHMIHSIFSAIAYAALNLGLAISVLVPLGNEIRDRNTLITGAWIGALGLGFMLVGAQFAMLLRTPDIFHYEVPMAFITSGYGIAIQVLFLGVLWGEIYSTLIANVFGIHSQVYSPYSQKQSSLVTVLILTTAYFISQIGFSNIVAYMYPIFGYVSFLLLMLLLWPRSKYFIE